MSDWSTMKRGPEMTGWLRAPAAGMFLKHVREHRDRALSNLIGAAAMASDPKVTKAHSQWVELDGLVKYLEKSRSESTGDD